MGTNGWDGEVRNAICRNFHLNFDEIDDRHRLMFDTYERGFMTFDEYLRHVFFSYKRPFSLEDVRSFAFNQSVAWSENIAFFARLKAANRIKLALISNEGEGITEHRVGKFKLRELADFMVVSHFVHMRKPDRSIWQLALDLAQAQPGESIYIDDRKMFVDVAAELGFTAMQHICIADTAAQLRDLGLTIE